MHRAPTTVTLADSIPQMVVPLQQPAAAAQTRASTISATTGSANASATRPAARTGNPTSVQTVATSDDPDAAAAVGVEATARLGDLDAQQLKALLGQIGNLRAVPVSDPDPVTIRVNPTGDSPDGSSL
jgi:hypothetical protein